MEITRYKGRYCADIGNGQYVLNNGSMELMKCKKVPEGMKVIEAEIIAGIMIRNEDDFRWSVEHM